VQSFSEGGDMDISSIPHISAPASAPAEASTPRPPTADHRALVQAVKAINAIEMFGQNNELTFFLDRNTHRAVVRIVNRNTREVVQQIPSEYVLRLAEESRER
jgi:flagellar protein FlaG